MRYLKIFLILLVAVLIFENDEDEKITTLPIKSGDTGVWEKKRLNIRFSRATPLSARKAFFVKMGFTPVAFDVFGYDIAELDAKYAETMRSLLAAKFDYFRTIQLAAIQGTGILDYHIESKEKFAVQAGCQDKGEKKLKEPENIMDGEAIIPWYDGLLGITKAHNFLAEKNAVLEPQGIIIADEGPLFSHPDIAPALKKDESGQPIFWARNKNFFNAGHHGTHVACLAAGYRDGKGIDGVAAKNAYILPLVLDYDNDNYYFGSDVAIGLKYFFELEKKNKISFRVINMSFGSFRENYIIRAAIKTLKEKFFVAAAGNENINLDGEKKLYPASWRFPNVLSVAAIDNLGRLAVFSTDGSNYGKRFVDIAAPGTNIKSCLANGGYGVKEGTSMASPIVAGAAALLFSLDPSLGVRDVKAAFFFSVVSKEALKDKVRFGRQLDVFKAVEMAYALKK